MSPSGELFAVLDRIFDIGVSPRDDTVQLPGVGLVREWRGLRILTSRGVQIGAEIPLVRRFAWSPDSRGIVYVTGRYQGLYREDAEPSVWIWGVTDDRPRKIRDGSHHVAWPRFDGNIYLWEMIEGIASQVLKVNPATASIEKTTHRSIYFSPTGDYYYGPASFGAQENVYPCAMDFPLKNTSRVLSRRCGPSPSAWRGCA